MPNVVTACSNTKNYAYNLNHRHAFANTTNHKVFIWKVQYLRTVQVRGKHNDWIGQHICRVCTCKEAVATIHSSEVSINNFKKHESPIKNDMTDKHQLSPLYKQN